ncbi:MAG: hypothetical protein HYZ93_01805, partial [Candidatus Omnitrophica bacterium]|nr:hypothetical protein [Candidatus Omnitrophota bacterium]
VVSLSSLQAIEHQQRRLILINRTLVGVLPVVALLALVDCARWAAQSRRPIVAIPPSLEGLRRPLAQIPSLELPASLFEPPKRVESGPAGDSSQPAVQPQWKLMGVSLGGTKRALLKDAEGKQSVWVTEGQQIGACRVKEIRERSVVLETEGGSYEIRL